MDGAVPTACGPTRLVSGPSESQPSTSDEQRVFIFVNTGKNINTPLKGVFEVILTKISQS
jgi:hypothetical protein